MPVTFSELLDAFQLADFGDGAFEAFVDRRTGKVWTLEDPAITGEESDVPDDLGDEHYLPLPDKRSLGLGKPLALDFAREHLPDDLDDVRDMFGRRGAYRRFEDLLLRRGARDRWHAFEAAAEAAALRAWCADEGLEIDEG
jgi:hypothetical protein